MVIHYTIQTKIVEASKGRFPITHLFLPILANPTLFQPTGMTCNPTELQSKVLFFTLTHGQKFLRMRLGIQSDLTSIKSSF